MAVKFVVNKLEYPSWTSTTCSDDFKDEVEAIERIEMIDDGKKRVAIHPYPYQAKFLAGARSLLERGGGVIFLCTATGSGKSLACSLPSIIDKKETIFMYPTNELLHEQHGKFKKYLIDGEPYSNHARNDKQFPFNLVTSQEINLYLDVLKNKGKDIDIGEKHYRRVSSAYNLFSRSQNSFTTVDILYYVLTFRYGSVVIKGTGKYYEKAVTKLQLTMNEASRKLHRSVLRKSVFVFDEYDSYGIKEKHTVEVIIAYIMDDRLNNMKHPRVVVLSSATPNFSLKKKLEKMGIPVMVIKETEKIDGWPLKRQVMPTVQVTVVPDKNSYKDMPYIKKAMSRKLLNELKSFHDSSDSNVIVFIADSLFSDCKPLAKMIRGIVSDNTMIEINGTTARDFDRRIKSRNKGRIIIGNRSFDLGVDFNDIDWLVMGAPGKTRLMQRFGRLRGTAIDIKKCTMIVPGPVYQLMEREVTNRLDQDAPLTRKEFDDLVNLSSKGYKWTNDFSWYGWKYGSLEFLKLMSYKVGGLLDEEKWYKKATRSYAMLSKEPVINRLKDVFVALYGDKVSIDEFLSKNSFRRLLLSPGIKYINQSMFESIFISFRNQSILPVVVKDNNARKEDRYFVYNGLQIFRKGNVVNVHEIKHDKKRKTMKIQWSKEQQEDFDSSSIKVKKDVLYSGKNAEILVEIDGYNDRQNPVSLKLPYEAFESTMSFHKKEFDSFAKNYQLEPRGSDNKMDWRGTPYSMVLKGIEIRSKNHVPNLALVNKLLSRKFVIFFFVIDMSANNKKDVAGKKISLEKSFSSIPRRLSLPLFDGTMPFEIDGGNETLWGCAACNHDALMLECAVQKRSYINQHGYNKKKNGEQDDS
jgi:CRISPR-associated helicase Cas3